MKMPSTVLPTPTAASDLARNLAHATQLFTGCLLFGLAVALALRSLRALEVSLMAGLALAAFAMWGSAGLGMLERVTRHDWNGDGTIGPAPAGERLILVRGGRSSGFDMGRLIEFIRACGVNTTEEYLLTHGFPDDDEIAMYRNYIIDAGYGKAKNSDGSLGNGWRLIGTPEQVLAGMFGRSLPSPTGRGSA